MMKRLLIVLFFVFCMSATATYAQQSTDLQSISQQSGEDENKVQFYPNPATEYLTVKILNSQLLNAKIEIFSILGNKVQVVPEDRGGEEYRFDVQGLESGYYLLVIRDEVARFRETYKFLVN